MYIFKFFFFCNPKTPVRLHVGYLIARSGRGFVDFLSSFLLYRRSLHFNLFCHGTSLIVHVQNTDTFSPNFYTPFGDGRSHPLFFFETSATAVGQSSGMISEMLRDPDSPSFFGGSRSPSFVPSISTVRSSTVVWVSVRDGAGGDGNVSDGSGDGGGDGDGDGGGGGGGGGVDGGGSGGGGGGDGSGDGGGGFGGDNVGGGGNGVDGGDDGGSGGVGGGSGVDDGDEITSDTTTTGVTGVAVT